MTDEAQHMRHCTKEGLCSWVVDFDGEPCNKNCSSDSRKRPSEYRCETCDHGIVEKDKEGYTHRYCKHPEMQYRGSESTLLLGTEIIHIQDHGCMLHPMAIERITILEANIRKKDNDIAVITNLLRSRDHIQLQNSAIEDITPEGAAIVQTAKKEERERILDEMKAWANQATKESKDEFGQIPHGWILIEIDSLRGVKK